MTLRWGLLGCGDIARKRLARALIDSPRSCLLAACRRDEAKLRDFCQAFAIERGYRQERELLADSDVDAVYVATPVAQHLPQTLAAAAAGKHVLVEKPMARTVAECDAMIASCRERGVRLGVAYYRRFYPIVHRMKEIVASGEIGRPLAVRAATAIPFGLGPGDEGYWRVVPAEGGGGALMDIGSHRLDLFLDLFGDALDVRAACDTVAGSYEVEDSASVVLRFRGGVHGVLQCHFGSAVALDEFVVLGTDGKLTADPLNGRNLVVQRGQMSRTEVHPSPANLHAPLVADFVEAVEQGRAPRVRGEEGRRTNEIMERAYRDAAGRP